VFQRKSFRKKMEAPEAPFVLAVCDGMGGHPGGKEASRFVCRDISGRFHTPVDEAHVEEMLVDTQKAAEEKLTGNSATTLAGLVIGRAAGLMVFNAGDSRVYRLDSGTAVCVSHDHSPVQDMLDRDLISAEEAFLHPFKNLVSFGLGPAFRNNWPDRSPFVALDFPEKDNYLICSDGVSDILRDEDMGVILEGNPIEKAPLLIKTMQQIGLRDNTSFILVQKKPAG